MKSFTKIGAVLAAGFVALTLASAAGAQQTVGMKVYVPFSFLAGERVLPAGDYWVRVDQQFHTLDLRADGETMSHRTLLQSWGADRKGPATENGCLRFAVYGTDYVLKGIWTAGETRGYELTASTVEKQLAKAHQGAGTGEASVMIH